MRFCKIENLVHLKIAPTKLYLTTVKQSNLHVVANTSIDFCANLQPICTKNPLNRYATTPQNGQTNPNNSSVRADELFDCV